MGAEITTNFQPVELTINWEIEMNRTKTHSQYKKETEQKNNKEWTCARVRTKRIPHENYSNTGLTTNKLLRKSSVHPIQL